MAKLQTQHPLLMVTEVVSLSVVLYWEGRSGNERPVLRPEQLRAALVGMLPAGTGVGSVTVNMHGQYEEPPRA